jgi:hypothetical protein
VTNSGEAHSAFVFCLACHGVALLDDSTQEFARAGARVGGQRAKAANQALVEGLYSPATQSEHPGELAAAIAAHCRCGCPIVQRRVGLPAANLAITREVQSHARFATGRPTRVVHKEVKFTREARPMAGPGLPLGLALAHDTMLQCCNQIRRERGWGQQRKFGVGATTEGLGVQWVLRRWATGHGREA